MQPSIPQTQRFVELMHAPGGGTLAPSIYIPAGDGLGALTVDGPSACVERKLRQKGKQN